MSIQSALTAFLNSDKGIQKIANIQRKTIRENSGKISGIGADMYNSIVTDLIKCIQSFLPDSLKKARSNSLLDRSSYCIDDLKIQKDGKLYIGISFADVAVFRESVNPGLWPDGVPNIVMHLTNGWHAKGSTSGMWHGREIITRSNYDGDSFLFDAINEFNLTHISAQATLSNMYHR